MQISLLMVIAGCIRDIPRGPDLGDCAQPPEGTYTYGEIGIGTCLSGPADLRFFDQGGQTWLAVSNADPYRNFATGSVLVMDWAEVAARLDSRSGPIQIGMHELSATALPIFDDDTGDGVGGNPYLGGIGILPDTLLVTGRLTEGGNLKSGRDELWIVDTSDLGGSDSQLSLSGEITLEDDPFPVVVDEAGERVYVGNLTDHSVSVLTTDVLSDAPFPVEVIDVAPGATAEAASLGDLDGSGSFAEIASIGVTDTDFLPQESWTLSYVDGTSRLYVPSIEEGLDDASTEDDQALLRRWESVGVDYRATNFGFEEGLAGLRDPFFEPGIDGIPTVLAVRDLPTQAIVRAVSSTVAGSWFQDGYDLVAVPGFVLGSPTATVLPAEFGIYYDLKDELGDPAEIGLATSVDGAFYTHNGAVLSPPEGLSYEDPFVAFDQQARSYRMWLSVRDVEADTWSIGLALSADGRAWTEPEIVIDDAASPALAVMEGRYGMWMAVPSASATGWDHAFSWSHDGRTWSTPEVVVEGQLGGLAVDGTPPDAGVLFDRIGAWRLSGRDVGDLTELLPAAIGGAVDYGGFELAVTQGHEFSNEVVPRMRAGAALEPGSVIRFDGRTLLFATTIGLAERSRIAILEQIGDTWVTLVAPEDLEEMLQIDPDREAFSPAVAIDDDGLVMFYGLITPDGTELHRATSSDGVVFAPEGVDLLPPGEDLGFDSLDRVPHSVEMGPDGIRVWYTGSDGSRESIGSATAPDLRAPLAREPGPDADYRMAVGLPGSFDDTDVRDPLVVTIDGETHLYYVGFDGLQYAIGHAVVDDTNRLQRRFDLFSGLSQSSLTALERTFTGFGVNSPSLLSQTDDQIELLYGGFDGLAVRTGRALVDPSQPEQVFAAQRFPTVGDTLDFETTRGGDGDQVIELGQVVDSFITSGYGMSGMEIDEARGFLYVTSKLDNEVYVIDLRDDSTGSFSDANVLDLEGLLRIDTGAGLTGFRSAQVIESRDLLALTMLKPDGLVLVDLSRVVDDDIKDVDESVAVAVLPLPDLTRDEGEDTYAAIGGAGMALTADERTLFVSHFGGNGVSVFDLDLGAWGEEIAWVRNVGEGPHVVRLSPDGRWAVVANYIGVVTDQTASATLAIVDTDPSSETYLEVAGWLVNR